MKWAPFFLGFLMLAGACVVEDKSIVPDGSVEAGGCGACPADKPVCLDDVECVECTENDDDLCTERSQICNVELSECVDCLRDSDCTAADASRCDTESNECAPCETNAQCDGIEGLPACNASNICVECTPESESQTCVNNFSCSPATETCTETEVGSLDVCEACVADSECGDDGAASEAFRCVPMYYPDEQTRFPDDSTGFCLKTDEGDCERPYSVPMTNRTSLSEPTSVDDYCGINEALATCPAVLALLGDERCIGGTNEECPEGGICRSVGSLPNRCTYFCELVAQCPEGAPANTCPLSGSGGSDGKGYCGG